MIALLILACSFLDDEIVPAQAAAKPSLSESLGMLVTQLGDDDFNKRVAAEKRLIEIAKSNLKKVHEELQSALAKTTDPEVQFRLRSVIRTISANLPIEFTDAGLNDKTWRLFDKPKTATFSISEGVLEIDSTEKIEEALMFMHDLDKGRKVQRLVLDAEIKVLTEKRDREGLAGVHLNIEDSLSSYAMMIQPDGIFAYRNNFKHKMDTTDRWHHYRMTVEGPLQQFFVDDMSQPVIELRRRGSGRHWVSFGDGTAGAGVHAQIRNVRFSRYESPAKKKLVRMWNGRRRLASNIEWARINLERIHGINRCQSLT